ncbi:hypothetical protein BDR26DRAFT_259752 [Obelidium mucronatum]|nr:hypothetical protein BDR26DRAFT_259752 [Obelidium mucronatum]
MAKTRATASVPTPAAPPSMAGSILSPTVSTINISPRTSAAATATDPPAVVSSATTTRPANTTTVPSTSATTDALMARLKALQPGANISTPSQSSNVRPPQLQKQSSSFTDAPSSSNPTSRPITPLNVPSAPTSQNSRSTSGLDLIAPPPLIRSSSGSNGGSNSGGSGARVLKDLKMTPGELHAGLLSIPQGSKTRVLILDVRPMEDYIQGHVRWPDTRNAKGSDIASGLVHIEPDWLHPGVDSDHIVHCLRGFTAADDPRLMMFDYRNLYEVIVCYDASSQSVHNSPVLTHLITALFIGEKNSSRVLSRQPIVLDGGFSGWMEFCKRKNLHLGNWVEIGEGVGGGGAQLGVDGVSSTISSNSSPTPGHAILPTPKPTTGQYSTQYTPPIGNQYGNAKVSYVGGPNQFTPNQGSAGAVAGVLYGNEPTRRSSYLQFEDPFMNFSNTGVSGSAYPYTSAYPRLPNQMSPLYGRQTSFTGSSAGPTEYPSLAPLTSNLPQVGGAAPPPVIPQKPASMTMSPQQQQFPQTATQSAPQQVQQPHVLHQQLSQTALQQRAQEQAYQKQQYIQQQQQQQQQQPQQQQLPAQTQQQYQTQPIPPPTPAKPTLPPAVPVKKAPPPIPAKPRLSITSVELTQTSPAYSNPDDFISISTLGSSIGVVGLKNLGNTCFMNSTLQCLSGTVPLARYFLGGNYRKGINRSNPMGTKGVIAEEFSQVIKSMWSGQESIVTPSQFKERVGEFAEQFRGTDQHDSQEFLGFLLDSVHEDLNIARGVTRKEIDTKSQEDETIPDDIRLQMAWNNYRSQNWSIIVDLFQGQLKSKLECLTCHTVTVFYKVIIIDSIPNSKTSTTFNAFMYLSLPIPATNASGVSGGPVYLDECLDKFVEVEILDGEDAWNCSKCKVKRRTRKTMTIAKLPPILLIHLKRFYYQGPFKSKLETYVDFPLASMDLGRYVAAGGSAAAPGSQVYDLYAVSNHTGTLTGGHYTATVHNNSKKAWYNFSDTRVGVCDVNGLKSNSAYILFYVRKASPNSQMTQTDWWK